MRRKRIPGLQKLGNIWHIDKRVNGQRVCESTGTSNLEEAEKFLIRRLESIRQAKIYGIRPQVTFRQAAIKYLLENKHLSSIHTNAGYLKTIDPFIGDLFLDEIHMGTLQSYIEARRANKITSRTINLALQIVRRILNLAAKEWINEYNLTWIASAPKIRLLAEPDLRKPYPLTWEEQETFFSTLPHHLREMALFAVNTGCRDQEVCQLRWEWETQVPINEIGTVFVIPREYVKNREDRLVVLNHYAREVIERQRAIHSEFVFVYRNRALNHMLNNGWRETRMKTGIPVRVHDLKHTFGRRLRAAGISFEDRQDLLGHKSSRITTHYSSSELLNLWEAANSICHVQAKSSHTLLRQTKNRLVHEKFTNSKKSVELKEVS